MCHYVFGKQTPSRLGAAFWLDCGCARVCDMVWCLRESTRRRSRHPLSLWPCACGRSCPLQPRQDVAGGRGQDGRGGAGGGGGREEEGTPHHDACMGGDGYLARFFEVHSSSTKTSKYRAMSRRMHVAGQHYNVACKCRSPSDQPPHSSQAHLSRQSSCVCSSLDVTTSNSAAYLRCKAGCDGSTLPRRSRSLTAKCDLI